MRDGHKALQHAVRRWLALKEEKRQAVREFNQAIHQLEEEIERISRRLEEEDGQPQLPFDPDRVSVEVRLADGDAGDEEETAAGPIDGDGHVPAPVSRGTFPPRGDASKPGASDRPDVTIPSPAVRVPREVEAEPLAAMGDGDGAGRAEGAPPPRPVCSMCGSPCRWDPVARRWFHLQQNGRRPPHHRPQFTGYGPGGPDTMQVIESLGYWRLEDSKAPAETPDASEPGGILADGEMEVADAG